MAKILPVASGKGGVGKTFLVTNLSLALAKAGQKVIVIDLDLGASNLHTFLGLKNTSLSIGHFINDKKIGFDQLIHETQYENLSIIPGDCLFLGTGNLHFFRKLKIKEEISKLEADWVIIDLGSGTTANTLDFFLISDCGVIVTTPEITSVLNLYSFLKNAYYRYICRHFKRKDQFRIKLNEYAKLRLEKGDYRFKDLLLLLKKDYPEEKENLEQICSRFFPKLLLNMVRENDAHFGSNLKNIIVHNLGLKPEFLGLLPYDCQVVNSIMNRNPYYTNQEQSLIHKNINKMAERLLAFYDYPASIYKPEQEPVDIFQQDWGE